MTKHHEKTYRRGHKADQMSQADAKEAGTEALLHYGLKQEQDIEEILSPFWAWRSDRT